MEVGFIKMDSQKNNRLLPTSLILILIGASFFCGIYVGDQKNSDTFNPSASGIKDANSPFPTGVEFAPFWRAWAEIDKKFITSSTSTEEKIDNQARVWGAIQGMVASLGDPYTVFLPPTESKIFKSDIKGNFGGVGLEVGVRDNLLTVISPLKNTPAGRSIIKTGDIILKIDDGSTEKLSVDEAVGLIRGEVGTKVKLDILRQNNATTTENFVVTLTRATIDIPTIETEFRSDGIFVIRLFSFSETSSNLFREALRNFVRTGSSKLILDLRGNPGGYLEAAVNMASWFLPPGAVVVQEDYKNDEENVIHRSKGFDIFDEKLKMVILIDGGSASASEILAGALREQNIATLIGTDSFGKGSVQELIEFTSNTSLKITIAQWLTPNGNSISAGGLKPDIEVKPAEKNPGPDNDLQMKAAVEFLLKK